MKKHLEVGLVFQAALLGLLAGHLDVGGIETDRGGGHCCACTWFRPELQSSFRKGLGKILVEFCLVVEPPLGFFGFGFEFRNDSVSTCQIGLSAF